MSTLITDSQSLVSVKSRFGTDIKHYDDGFGSLWVYRDSMGIVGVVRAQTESDVWDCILDELLTPEPTSDVQANPNDYYVCEREYHCAAPKDYKKGYCLCYLLENSHYRKCWKCRQYSPSVFPNHNPKECTCTAPKQLEHPTYLTLAEGYHYQPNATGSGIVATDLNGEALELLTDELATQLGITLELSDD